MSDIITNELGVAKGVVKTFDYGRGFGFVVTPIIEVDIFLHARRLPKGCAVFQGTHLTFGYGAEADGRYRVTRVISWDNLKARVNDP